VAYRPRVQFDDLTDGVLSLRAANEFVQEWVDNNFLPTLTERLRELTGHSIQVAWVLDGQLTAPIASGIQRTPIRPRSVMLRPSDAPPPTDGDQGRAMTPRPSLVRSAPHCVSIVDLNPKQTFATFVVGPSNQLAHAAAVAAAGGGGRRYNPLFICGGTGPRQDPPHARDRPPHVSEERPAARIIYVSAERFTNDFIHSIQHHRMDEFRAKLPVVSAICCWSTTSSSSRGASRRRRSSSTRSTRSTPRIARSS
jgi:chromosomal replication initiator protein